MHLLLVGGKKAAARRKFILSPIADEQNYLYEKDRHELLKESIERFIRLHKKWGEKEFKVSRSDGSYMSEFISGSGALRNHYSIFIGALKNLGTEEQVKYWLPKAMKFEIIGNYC